MIQILQALYQELTTHYSTNPHHIRIGHSIQIGRDTLGQDHLTIAQNHHHCKINILGQTIRLNRQTTYPHTEKGKTLGHNTFYEPHIYYDLNDPKSIDQLLQATTTYLNQPAFGPITIAYLKTTPNPGTLTTPKPEDPTQHAKPLHHRPT